jgi:hypothetical protein
MLHRQIDRLSREHRSNTMSGNIDFDAIEFDYYVTPSASHEACRSPNLPNHPPGHASRLNGFSSARVRRAVET